MERPNYGQVFNSFQEVYNAIDMPPTTDQVNPPAYERSVDQDSNYGWSNMFKFDANREQQMLDDLMARHDAVMKQYKGKAAQQQQGRTAGSYGRQALGSAKSALKSQGKAVKSAVRHPIQTLSGQGDAVDYAKKAAGSAKDALISQGKATKTALRHPIRTAQGAGRFAKRQAAKAVSAVGQGVKKAGQGAYNAVAKRFGGNKEATANRDDINAQIKALDEQLNQLKEKARADVEMRGQAQQS